MTIKFHDFFQLFMHEKLKKLGVGRSEVSENERVMLSYAGAVGSEPLTNYMVYSV